jgi:hypothetical protein
MGKKKEAVNELAELCKNLSVGYVNKSVLTEIEIFEESIEIGQVRKVKARR